MQEAARQVHHNISHSLLLGIVRVPRIKAEAAGKSVNIPLREKKSLSVPLDCCGRNGSFVI